MKEIYEKNCGLLVGPWLVGLNFDGLRQLMQVDGWLYCVQTTDGPGIHYLLYHNWIVCLLCYSIIQFRFQPAKVLYN